MYRFRAPFPNTSSAIREQLRGDELGRIWSALQLDYFPERPDLLGYRVLWSRRRQTTVLASCNVETLCISVAGALAYGEYRWLLSPLLYHEMCHAVLGRPALIRGRRIIHGRDFKLLEQRHPYTPVLNNWIRTGGWMEAVRRHERTTRRSQRGRRSWFRAVF